MGNKNKFNCYLLLLITIISATLYGCQKDVFNPELIKATYQDRFPVKDIDPSMDWKMTRKVNVNVSVNENVDKVYTIRIYDNNPLLFKSSAKLLAEGTAETNNPFITKMDCPNTLTDLFICRIDEQNRNVVKYASIENEQINVTFGDSQTATRSIWTRNVNIETFTPEKSESEIKAMIPNATEITSNTNFQNGGVYKISQNSTYRGQISKGGLNASNPVTIIIEGTWTTNDANMNVERGFNFYVINEGSIIIPKNYTLTLKNSSRFYVYTGGTIQGGDIELTNASDGNYNYNAGTIDIINFHVSSTGAFYNCGIARVKAMLFDSGCKFINQGKAYIDAVHSNITVENGCYFYAKEFVGKLNMGNSSSAEIENFGNRNNNYNTQITMGANSMITATTKAALTQAKFIGPNDQFALVKIKKIEDIANFSSTGNIYYEVEEINSSITEDIWWQSKFLEVIKNSNGSISKWGESPITIPEGDCTGKGNTPNDSGSETPTDPLSYTYVFEDNFPKVGDYDFNDLVLDVETEVFRNKRTNQIKQIQLNVTLTAAGASKALGVGLRIVGINKSDIRKITTGGDDRRFQSSFNDQNNKFNYNSSNYMEDNDPNVVIPIAGEVHNVFGVELGTIVNTGSGVTAKTYTYEIKIELADQTKTEPLISKDNLDFFICYQYQMMKKRMEVHLYEFWGYGATAAGTIQKENLDVAGNNTWAICVPYGFRYPKETYNISRTDDPQAGAYPNFIYWAKDRNNHKDWYNNPVVKNVYR